MGTVHEKLDEAIAEIEKLRADYKIKAESSENFKRAYNEQLAKIRDANCKVDKLTLELSMKEDELSVAKQTYEELKSNLKDKETAIKSLTSANDRLRADCAQKLKKFEEENRRDDVVLKLDEENRELEDQLKWKKEQFAHLVEAHEKIRQQFREREKEWEKEKDTLINQISTLQLNLDSQIRISEGLQRRLQRCNQALAHEESRRKSLEVQLSGELAESIYVGKVIESEMQIWRSLAERLKSSLDENHQMHRELEASLFAQVDVEFELRWEKDKLEHILADKEEEINELREQIVVLNEELKKTETRALQTPQGMKNSLDIHKELESFEEEWLRKELEKIMQTCDSTGRFVVDVKRVDKLFDSAKENLHICLSPTKNVETDMVEDRLPFRAINN